jgi:hypothetical protein
MPCAAKSGSLKTLGQRFGTFQLIMSIRWAFLCAKFWIYGLHAVAVLLDCRSRELFLQKKVLSWVCSFFLLAAFSLGHVLLQVLVFHWVGGLCLNWSENMRNELQRCER